MGELSEPREIGFNERVLTLVRAADQRPAMNEAERDDIYRLRFAGYQRAKMITPEVPSVFRDKYDDSSNGKTLGVYLGNRLAASIRVHIASRETPIAPALNVYPDVLLPLLESGKVVVDPTRHVVASYFARLCPKLPYVTVRLAWLACEHYGADFVLATIPSHHRPFYRRIFGNGFESVGRIYPGISVPVVLLAWDYKQTKKEVNRRYPFLESDVRERIAIFGGGRDPDKNRQLLAVQPALRLESTV